MTELDNRTARELWLMQLRLERKRLTDDGRLVRLPGDDPDEIPVAALTRFAHGTEWAFAESTPAESVRSFRRLEADTVFAGTNPPSPPGLRLERYVTYRLLDPTRAERPDVRRTGRDQFVLIADDHEVAWASSARADDECAELWVHTDPAYQRRGYGAAVAAAWAAEVITSGRIAFYSHHAENEPSGRLVQHLGGIHLFDLAVFVPTSEART